MSHLCRPGKCTNLIHWLHCHTGLSGLSPGLWQRPNSPGDPRLVKLCGQGPHHPGDFHDKLHCECDQGERDRCPGDALGKCPGGLSFGSFNELWPQWKMIKLLLGSQTQVNTNTKTTKESETIDAFSSHIIHARMGITHTGEGINVMTQALHAEDWSLLQVLTVQNAYTELCSGSKNVAVVVRNSMAYPKTLRKKTPVARAVKLHKYQDPLCWLV